MLEKIWQFAVLANLPSVATAYTGKLVFCLYVVYTSAPNEMCYTVRLLPASTHIQQHLLCLSIYSRSFVYVSVSVRKIMLLGKTELKGGHVRVEQKAVFALQIYGKIVSLCA